MRKIILVGGVLAAGKSTYANILKERFYLTAITKDRLKEILGDNIHVKNREENKKLSNATAELMCFIFSEFGKLNKNLILESNFHTIELEKMHKMAFENNYEVLTIVLRGDVEILYKRYLNRMHNENRHPVHLSTTLDVFDDFKGYTEYSRTEKIPGSTLCINADDFSYQTDKEILRKIDEFMERC